MPRVSQWALEDDRMKELIGQLWNGFTLLEDRNEVKHFLSKFFTPTEIEMFAKRLELLKLADSDLEVNELRKLLHVAKVTIYEWLDKHDAYEDNFHVVTDRLRELDQKHLERQKEKREALTRIPKRTSVGAEVLKIGVKLAYRGYKKRKKRESVLKTVE